VGLDTEPVGSSFQAVSVRFEAQDLLQTESGVESRVIFEALGDATCFNSEVRELASEEVQGVNRLLGRHAFRSFRVRPFHLSRYQVKGWGSRFLRPGRPPNDPKISFGVVWGRPVDFVPSPSPNAVAVRGWSGVVG